MISDLYIEEWFGKAPWKQKFMIEQDMVITRALIELYNNPVIRKSLVFRGGTALNKVYFEKPTRYSEDIDFVQIAPAPIGDVVNSIRESLDNLLGEPKRKFTERSVKLIYRYQNIENTVSKLKLEINTTEHFHIEPLRKVSCKMESTWWQGHSDELLTYSLNELMATKLKAMYQRKKGRDLYDLWYVIKNNLIDPAKVIPIFKLYCKEEKVIITRKLFDINLQEKKENRDYLEDVKPLLALNSSWNEDEAFTLLEQTLIEKL